MDDFMTVRDAERYSGISVGHLGLLLREGKIAGRKVGGGIWIVDKASLDAYLATRKGQGRASPQTEHSEGDQGEPADRAEAPEGEGKAEASAHA